MNQQFLTAHAVQTAGGALIILLLVAIALVLLWIVTFVNILKSDFEEPTNKTVWFLAVIFVAPLGVILYWTIGKDQRVIEIEEKGDDIDYSYRGRRRD